MRREKWVKRICFVIAVFIALIYIFPIYVLVINSFKDLKSIYTDITGLPSSFSLANYMDAFGRLDYIRSFLNSLLITGCGTFCIVFFSSMSAWVLARSRTRLANVIFMVFAGSMIIPFQCVMLPLVTEMGKLNMLNRHGLVFMNTGFASGFAIMLFHGFIKNVPVELEEAAAIDGCPRARCFFVIVMPLMKSIYVTVAILNVMTLWNDYLLPSLTINKGGMQTLPLKTYLFFGQFAKRWDLGTAGLVMVMIPIVIFYILCQKQIIKGVTEGAMKG